MHKFYIHKNNQQKGPFTKEELKNLNVTRNTKVWYEGADNWKNAGDIEILQDIFKSSPPPLIEEVSSDKVAIDEIVKPRKTSVQTIIYFSAIVLIILVYIIYNMQHSRKMEIQMQFDEQQKVLERQEAKIKEQEQIEAARLEKERKQKQAEFEAQRQAELESLKVQYDKALTSLRSEKIKLEEIQQFRLLRTASERRQQVQDQLELIRTLENEVERLKNEIDKF